MAVDLQDLSRRLFQTANQLWANTALRPDQYAQPVLALAQGVKVMREDRDNQLCFHLSLGTVLLELTGKPQDYALSGNDHVLLEIAQEVYLASAA